ncbi:hypothetical protein AB0K80_03690 [Streptomyces sp. NPDC052682]|uniref:hypothetical protein n=1 Tax=Streptomyces sp. NPDC052682 TaxID=3154954 RepID=UPI00343551E3
MDEKKLGDRATAAVGAADEDDDRFVESGLERVTEGIHTRPELEQGKSYHLVVACAGKGAVRIVVQGQSSREAACDGATDRQRITGKRGRLAIDVEGVKDSAGMVAWRITP